MFRPSKKSKLRRLSKNKMIALVLFFASIFLFIGTVLPAKKSAIVADKVNKLKEDLNEEETRKTDIETKINDLESDFGFEKALREKLPVGKVGEEIIIFYDDENESQSASVKESTERKGLFWKLFNKD